ncbi:MAG TPA: thioredoxin, partial [Wenzhouxiangella sp.]|nr:thioredoxin [Wenzhouxiangella sp.]
MQRIYTLSLFAIVIGLANAAFAQGESAPLEGMTMHVFMSETCPHCQAQKPFLASLDSNHPLLDIVHMEVMTTREHHDLLRNMASLHGVQPGSVPMIFFGGR